MEFGTLSQYIIISVLAILTETIFIYFMFKKSKNINDKKILLFLGILASYILSGIITGFSYNLQVWIYLVFNILIFIFVKILYGKKISVLDFLIIGYILYFIGFPSSLAAYLCDIHLINLTVAFIISRIIIFSILLFSYKHLNKIYQKIAKFWNRRDDGKIKSLTIRNLLLIGVNVILYIIHILFSMML